MEPGKVSRETAGPPPLCGWETVWLAASLARRLAGGRVERVDAPTPETLALRMYAGGETAALVLWSAARGSAAFTGDSDAFHARVGLPSLGDWSASLKGARLGAVHHDFPLRRLSLLWETDHGEHRLVLDAVKSGGNLYLVDRDGRVVRRWRNRGYPPGETLDRPDVAPFPPPFSDLSAGTPPGMDERFCARCRALEPALQSNLCTCEPDAVVLSQLYHTGHADFPSYWSARCMEAWTLHRTQWWRSRQMAPLQQERARLVRALARQEDDRRALGDPEVLRRQGDLLAANLSRLRRGMDGVEVEDLFAPSGGTIRLPLDPARSPQENLEAVYARYAKARRGLLEVERRQAERRARLAEIQQDLAALAVAQPDLETLAAPPAAAPPGKPKPRDQDLPKGVQKWLTREGCELYLGRNADGNDRLVRHILRGHDYWFHVADGTGSHVVLRSPAKGKEPPESAMREAARLAHYNSSLRDEPATVVVAVPGKWVRRVKGGAPGRVTYSHPRTFHVDPDPGLFSRLTIA